MKKMIPVLLIFVLLLAGCGSRHLTQEKAREIAIAALEVSEKDVSDIHVHATAYDGAACYSFHITVDGHAYEVIVDSLTGEVLHTGDSSH